MQPVLPLWSVLYQRYEYRLYFSYSGYSQTLLDPVFDADRDARISSGQGQRQLAAFQRQKSGAGGDIGAAAQLSC